MNTPAINVKITTQEYQQIKNTAAQTNRLSDGNIKHTGDTAPQVCDETGSTGLHLTRSKNCHLT